jgi:hypothetical protein
MSNTLISPYILLQTMATELHRRWLDVSDAEYERRMRARNNRNGGDGCSFIAMIIILSMLPSC